MEKILILVKNRREKIQLFYSLIEQLGDFVKSCQFTFGNIQTNRFLIKIAYDEEKYYRGRRVEYYYSVYNSNSYLDATGAKRIETEKQLLELLKEGLDG